MNQAFSKNLPLLARNPQLLKTVEGFQNIPSKAVYQIEKAKNGSPTIIVREDRKTFTCHSRYDPQAEARKLVDTSLGDFSHVVILGFGLGYILDEVISRLPQPGHSHQVLIIEPDARLLFHALHNRDLRGVLSDERIDWCVGMNPDQVGETWSLALDWAALNKLCIIEHPPSISRNAQYFERIKEKIRYFCQRSKGNLVTLMHNGIEFLTNNLLNMGAVVHFPGVGRLFEKFSGIPAIVVAAGPSLEKNVHLLSKVKGKFLIIAVDTAFRQLAIRGISPDIVCAADPSYENSLDFVGVEDEKEVILAFEPMSHPDIPRCFKGPKMLMTFGGGILGWLEKFREPIGTLTCWGSIATTTFDMARRFGCDPIIFIGLDLSFQDGRLHARGSFSDDVLYSSLHPYTSLEHETVDYVSTRGVHKYTGPNGGELFTDQNMQLYKGWFEDQFRQTRQKVINATEGGIVDRFVDRMPLEQVIGQFWNSGGDIPGILGSAIGRPPAIDRPSLSTELQRIMDDLHNQEQMTREGISLCKKIGKGYSKEKVADLTGNAKALYEDILKIHDDLCQESPIFSWFTIHQTRFITRHVMEMAGLRENKSATVEEWGKELRDFFEAKIKFHNYQIPLMESGIRSIEN